MKLKVTRGFKNDLILNLNLIAPDFKIKRTCKCNFRHPICNSVFTAFWVSITVPFKSAFSIVIQTAFLVHF